MKKNQEKIRELFERHKIEPKYDSVDSGQEIEIDEIVTRKRGRLRKCNAISSAKEVNTLNKSINTYSVKTEADLFEVEYNEDSSCEQESSNRGYTEEAVVSEEVEDEEENLEDGEDGDEEEEVNVELVKTRRRRTKSSINNIEKKVATPEKTKKGVYRHITQFIRTMKEMNLLHCNLCSEAEEFKDLRDLRAHYKRAHQTAGYVMCCTKKLVKSNYIYDHIQFHLDSAVFRCTDCGKCFGNKNLLVNHQKMMHAEVVARVKCETCGRKFKSHNFLKQHLYTHMGDEARIHKCDKCDKAFKTTYRLKDHKNMAHGPTKKLMICDECGATFVSMANLNHHQNIHHNPARERKACEICGKFVFRLESHRLTHARAEQPVSCDECGNVLKNKHSLMIHKKTLHNKDAQMHPCAVCNKSFRSRYKLSEHTSIHTGIKRFTCHFCPEQFAAATNRTKHCKLRHPEDLKKWRDAKYQFRIENNM